MKKGFTLIELLAVIIILTIILIIAVPKILDTIESARVKVYESNEKMLEKAASTYMYMSDITPPTKGTSVKINLSELKDSGLIKRLTDVKDKNQECDGYVEITKELTYYKYKGYLDCGNNYKTLGFNGLELPIFTAVGDGARDYFNSVSKTTVGYIAAGNSDSVNKDLEEINKGTTFAILVNYDNAGNIIWKKSYGGTSLDYFYGVATASDGYIAVGHSSSIDGDLSGLNKGGIDATIVKYDLNGNILWKRNYGGTSSDYFRDVTVVSNGYVVVGYSYSSNDDLSGLNKGGHDGIIVKYDFNGNIVWKYNYGGTGTDYFYNIKSTTDGLIVVGSNGSTNGDSTGLNKGGYDGVIVKYDFNGNIVWKQNYGGTGTDYFTSVDIVSDGYVAVGYSGSTNVDLLNLNKGSDDSIIVKYDLLGNVVWKKNHGGTGVDNFWGVSVAPDGNIIAVGRSRSSDGDMTGIFKGSSTSYYIATMIKYSSTGNIILAKTFGGTGSTYDYFDAVITTSDSYIVIGNSNSTTSDLLGLNKGDYDAIIAKYNTDGTIAWNKNFGGGPGADYFDSVAVSNDAYFAVGNSSSTEGVFNDINKGGIDAIIFKYDLAGNLLWNKNFGGTSVDYFYGTIPCDDGVIVVGSSASGNGDITGNSIKGGYDGIIVKYDVNGNIIWKKNYGGTSSDYFYGITETSDGYVVVGSSASSTDDFSGKNNGGTDAIIIKIDKEGNIIWTENYGGTGTDVFKSVEFTINGNLVAVGNSNSTDIDLVGLNKGDYDGIVVKYDPDGNLEWKKNYGGTLVDYFTDIASFSGDSYIVGYSSSVNDDLLDLNKGGSDSIIAKYNSNGEILWKQNYGGTSTDYFYGVKIWNNQIVTVGSSASGNVDITGTSPKGSYDATMVKYDLEGNILYKTNYGGTGADYFKAVTIARNGLIMVGYESSLTNDFLDIGSGFIDAMTVGYTE